MTVTSVSFVLFCFRPVLPFLSRYMEGKNCQRLFAMIFCLFSVLLLFGRQPTEYVNEAGSCSSCGVVRATWF